MATYKCTNLKCKEHNKLIVSSERVILNWNDSLSEYRSNLLCKECNKPLKLVNEVDLDKVSSINKGATKVSKDKRNTVY